MMALTSYGGFLPTGILERSMGRSFEDTQKEGAVCGLSEGAREGVTPAPSPLARHPRACPGDPWSGRRLSWRRAAQRGPLPQPCRRGMGPRDKPGDDERWGMRADPTHRG